MRSGYAGTGLSDVLKQAGVPKGSFYHYFESKEAFCAEVVRIYATFIVATFDRHIAEQGVSAIEKIRRFHRTLAGLIEQSGDYPGCLLGSLSLEVGSASGAVNEALEEGIIAWTERYTSLIEEALGNGEISTQISPETGARLIWNQWQGALARLQVERDIPALLENLETQLDLICGCRETGRTAETN